MARARPGETQLWRLANISANIYYNVRLRGQKLQVISHGGFPPDRIWAAGSLLLAAGARFDVLVQGGPPGSTVPETLPYNTGPAGNQFPQATLPPWSPKGRSCGNGANARHATAWHKHVLLPSIRSGTERSTSPGFLHPGLHLVKFCQQCLPREQFGC